MNELSWLTTILPAVIPVLIALVKFLVPVIPKWCLPVLAPILGAAVELLGYYAGLTAGDPAKGAIFGGLGVVVREVYDQIKKAIAPPPA